MAAEACAWFIAAGSAGGLTGCCVDVEGCTGGSVGDGTDGLTTAGGVSSEGVVTGDSKTESPLSELGFVACCLTISSTASNRVLSTESSSCSPRDRSFSISAANCKSSSGVTPSGGVNAPVSSAFLMDSAISRLVTSTLNS